MTELFVAVGSDAGGSKIATSPNGISWTERTPAGGYNDVCWSPDLGLFVNVGDVGALATSPDGITWTSRTSGTGNGIRAVTWSPELGLFVRVGLFGQIGTSPDGITWTSRTSGTSEDLEEVAWSPELDLFVAVGDDRTILSSPDGITWTTRQSGGVKYFSVAASPTLGFAAGSNLAHIAISSDGITWENATESLDGVPHSICWAEALGKFVLVTNSGYVATSADATNWTNTATISSMFAVAWSPTLSLLVAAGQDGYLATSPDATTWTSRTSQFGTVDILGVTWGESLAAVVTGWAVGGQIL